MLPLLIKIIHSLGKLFLSKGNPSSFIIVKWYCYLTFTAIHVTLTHLKPVFKHLCKVRHWILNTVYLFVYLSFQVLYLPLNSFMLILKRKWNNYVQNFSDREWKVSETGALAPLNRAKEIWKVMQGNGCTSISGFIF